MSTLSLTRRKTQLELLAHACHLQQPVRLTPHNVSADEMAENARLLALETDSILLAAPDGDTLGVLPTGSAMDVSFTHDGQQYAFTADIRAMESAPSGSDATPRRVRLSLPLRCERVCPRDEFRFVPADGEQVEVSLRDMFNSVWRFDTHLTGISADGFQVIMDRKRAERLHPRELFHAELKLPGRSPCADWVVRPAQSWPSPTDAHQAVVLWRVCPGDDPDFHGRSLTRFKQSIAGGPQDDPRSASARTGGGR